MGWQTYEVAGYPGDATTFRMVLLPAALAVALVGALLLARAHPARSTVAR